MSHSMSTLTLLVAALVEAESSWRGVVTVTGMIHEPGGYHPYTATITLHLREAGRAPVAGGFRVPLMSHGSINDVRTSVHQTDGPMLCSGIGTETLPADTVGYLETKGNKTSYYLVIPRAFGAFTCGQNRAIRRNRVVTIGRGDPVAAEIETADSMSRALEEGDSVMKGSFESTKTRGPVRYEYSISWSLSRAHEQP